MGGAGFHNTIIDLVLVQGGLTIVGDQFDSPAWSRLVAGTSALII